jgi:glycosyltransferase involved in cell wall biosynthesis
MKKTIIQLADYGGSYAGNFIASLIFLNNILNKSNWRQVLLFTNIAKNRAWIESLIKLEIPIYFVSKNSRLMLVKRVNEIVRRENGQILHTHFTTFDFPAWMVKQIRKNNNLLCEVIWHVHSPAPRRSSISNRIKDFIRFYVARDVYKIVVSQGGLQNLLERGLSLHKTHVIPNGIDLKRAVQTTETKESICHQFSLDKDSLTLLQLGWDPIGKGVDISLSALEELRNCNFNIQLLLVGTERLQRYIAEFYGASIPSWLKILPFTEHIANYFQVADVFVTASRAEGFSYAVGEAMYYGLPVISSDIRGLEWAHSSPGVVFFPNQDVKGLINAITNVTTWPYHKKNKLIFYNKELIRNQYSVNIWGKKIVGIYENIYNK